jgi:hypothetical protein
MSEQNQYADLVMAAKCFSGLPQQIKALQDLQASLTAEQHKEFTNTWRKVTAAQPVQVRPKFPLNAPYFDQLDSKTNQGARMCQSSSIAMRIKQIDPKLISDDDSYLSIVNRYGDTVSQSAHQKALASLGLHAEFRQDGTEKLLCSLLDQGISVPIGVLHKGSINNPTGGGHWILLNGYDSTHFWCMDPFGEMDLVNGNYETNAHGSGKNVRYSRTNLMKRWLVNSSSDGWLWIIKR